MEKSHPSVGPSGWNSPRYRLERIIAVGGQGQVWHALDRATGQRVAVKISEPDGREALESEFLVGSSLKHPGWALALDFVTNEKSSGLVFEFLDGMTLAQLAEGLPEEAIAELAVRLLLALRALHQRRLLHGDITPANVHLLVSAEGPVVSTATLLDLGLARSFHRGSGREFSGTVGHQAPEMLKGGELDARADLYLLGLTLAKTWLGLEDQDETLVGVRRLESPLARWLSRMLADTKEDRPPDCDSALELGLSLRALPQPTARERLLSPPPCLTGAAAPVIVTALDLAKAGSRPLVRLTGSALSASADVLQHLLARTLLQGGRRFWAQGRVGAQQLALELAAEGKRGDAELTALQDKGWPLQLRVIEEEWAARAATGVTSLVLELDDEEDLRLAEALARCQPKGGLLVLLSKVPGLLAEFDEGERSAAECLEAEESGLPADEFTTWLAALLGTAAAGLGELSQALAVSSGGAPRMARRGLEVLLSAGLLRVDAGGRWSLLAGRRAKIASELAAASGPGANNSPKEPNDTLAVACMLTGQDGRTAPDLRSVLFNLGRPSAELERALAGGWLLRVDKGSLATSPQLRAADCVPSDRLEGLAQSVLQQSSSRDLEASILGRLQVFAGQTEEAHESFAEGAARALARGQSTVALALFESAAACRPPALELQLEAALADTGHARALLSTGESARAFTLLEAALASHARSSGACRAALLSAFADVLQQAGRFDEMRDAAMAGLKALGSRGPRKERAGLHLQLAGALGRLDELASARAELERAEALASQLPEGHLQARVLEERATVELLAEDGEAAWRLADLARSLALQDGDPGALARSLNLLCLAASLRGQTDEALALAEEAATLHRRAGDLVREMEAESFRASLLGQGGRSEQALAAHHRVLVIARRIGEPSHEASTLHHLGLHAHRSGDWDEARARLMEAESAFLEAGEKQGAATSLRLLAALLRDKGDHDDAEATLDRVEDLLETGSSLHALCLRTRASLALRVGDAARAADLVGALLSETEGGLDPTTEGDCRRLLSQALLIRGHAQDSFTEADRAVRLLRGGHATLAALALEARAAARALLPMDSRHASPEEAGLEGGAESRRHALVDGDLAAAFRLHESVAAPFEVARFHQNQAHILLGSGRARQRGQAASIAEASLQEALTCFDRLGARAHHAEVQELLTELSRGGPAAAGEKDTRTLSTLHEVARVLNGSLDLRDVLEAALDLLLPSLDVERAAILLLAAPSSKEPQPCLRVAASRNIDEETGTDALNYSHTVVLDVDGRGIPLVAPDALTDPRFADCLSVTRHEIRSLACVPLRSGDEIRGAVYVDDRRTLRRFTEEDIHFLQAFADLAAPAIANARLVEELKEAGQRLAAEALDLRRQVRKRFRFEGMVGESAAMEHVYSSISMVADSNATVLVTGENGTGKELVARAVHDAGRRKDEPFLALNCAALPETLLEAELFGIEKGTATGVSGRMGKFEQADGGTLFLDEIGDMSVGMQARLLRVLQERSFHRVGGDRNITVNVHVIAATNVNLEKAVAEKTFRQDLYYRLNVVPIPVPALRDRREDIPSLLEHFQAEFLKEEHVGGEPTPPFTLTEGARDILVTHDWPGNIRQLRNLVQRLVLLHPGGRVDIEDLPDEFRGEREELLVASASKELTMNEIKRRYARLMLARCGGNKRKTSRTLGIAFKTLQTYLGEA